MLLIDEDDHHQGDEVRRKCEQLIQLETLESFYDHLSLNKNDISEELVYLFRITNKIFEVIPSDMVHHKVQDSELLIGLLSKISLFGSEVIEENEDIRDKLRSNFMQIMVSISKLKEGGGFLILKNEKIGNFFEEILENGLKILESGNDLESGDDEIQEVEYTLEILSNLSHEFQSENLPISKKLKTQIVTFLNHKNTPLSILELSLPFLSQGINIESDIFKNLNVIVIAQKIEECEDQNLINRVNKLIVMILGTSSIQELCSLEKLRILNNVKGLNQILNIRQIFQKIEKEELMINSLNVVKENLDNSNNQDLESGLSLKYLMKIVHKILQGSSNISKFLKIFNEKSGIEILNRIFRFTDNLNNQNSSLDCLSIITDSSTSNKNSEIIPKKIKQALIKNWDRLFLFESDISNKMRDIIISFLKFFKTIIKLTKGDEQYLEFKDFYIRLIKIIKIFKDNNSIVCRVIKIFLKSNYNSSSHSSSLFTELKNVVRENEYERGRCDDLILDLILKLKKNDDSFIKNNEEAFTVLALIHYENANERSKKVVDSENVSIAGINDEDLEENIEEQKKYLREELIEFALNDDLKLVKLLESLKEQINKIKNLIKKNQGVLLEETLIILLFMLKKGSNFGQALKNHVILILKAVGESLISTKNYQKLGKIYDLIFEVFGLMVKHVIVGDGISGQESVLKMINEQKMGIELISFSLNAMNKTRHDIPTKMIFLDGILSCLESEFNIIRNKVIEDPNLIQKYSKREIIFGFKITKEDKNIKSSNQSKDANKYQGSRLVSKMMIKIEKQMKLYGKMNPKLFKSGCQILGMLASLSEIKQKEMIRNGIPSMLQSIIGDKSYPKESHEEAVNLLKELSSGSFSSKKAIKNGGALQSILKCLKHYQMKKVQVNDIALTYTQLKSPGIIQRGIFVTPKMMKNLKNIDFLIKPQEEIKSKKRSSGVTKTDAFKGKRAMSQNYITDPYESDSSNIKNISSKLIKSQAQKQNNELLESTIFEKPAPPRKQNSVDISTKKDKSIFKLTSSRIDFLSLSSISNIIEDNNNSEKIKKTLIFWKSKIEELKINTPNPPQTPPNNINDTEEIEELENNEKIVISKTDEYDILQLISNAIKQISKIKPQNKSHTSKFMDSGIINLIMETFIVLYHHPKICQKSVKALIMIEAIQPFQENFYYLAKSQNLIKEILKAIEVNQDQPLTLAEVIKLFSIFVKRDPKIVDKNFKKIEKFLVRKIEIQNEHIVEELPSISSFLDFSSNIKCFVLLSENKKIMELMILLKINELNLKTKNFLVERIHKKTGISSQQMRLMQQEIVIDSKKKNLSGLFFNKSQIKRINFESKVLQSTLVLSDILSPNDQEPLKQDPSLPHTFSDVIKNYESIPILLGLPLALKITLQKLIISIKVENNFKKLNSIHKNVLKFILYVSDLYSNPSNSLTQSRRFNTQENILSSYSEIITKLCSKIIQIFDVTKVIDEVISDLENKVNRDGFQIQGNEQCFSEINKLLNQEGILIRKKLTSKIQKIENIIDVLIDKIGVLEGSIVKDETANHISQTVDTLNENKVDISSLLKSQKIRNFFFELYLYNAKIIDKKHEELDTDIKEDKERKQKFGKSTKILKMMGMKFKSVKGDLPIIQEDEHFETYKRRTTKLDVSTMQVTSNVPVESEEDPEKGGLADEHISHFFKILTNFNENDETSSSNNNQNNEDKKGLTYLSYGDYNDESDNSQNQYGEDLSNINDLEDGKLSNIQLLKRVQQIRKSGKMPNKKFDPFHKQGLVKISEEVSSGSELAEEDDHNDENTKTDIQEGQHPKNPSQDQIKFPSLEYKPSYPQIHADPKQVFHIFLDQETKDLEWINDDNEDKDTSISGQDEIPVQIEYYSKKPEKITTTTTSNIEEKQEPKEYLGTSLNQPQHKPGQKQKQLYQIYSKGGSGKAQNRRQTRQEMMLDVSLLWSENESQNKKLAENPETFKAINRIIESESTNPQNLPSKLKAYELLKKLISKHKKSNPKFQENLSYLKPHYLIKIINNRISEYPDQGTKNQNNSKESIDDDLDTLRVVYDNQSDKTPFVQLKSLEVVVKKMKILSSNRPPTLSKTPSIPYTIGELALTTHTLVQEPVMLRKATQKLGITPIVVRSLKNIRKAKAIPKEGEPPRPDNSGLDDLQGVIEDGESNQYQFSSEPLTFAQENLVILASDISKSQKTSKLIYKTASTPIMNAHPNNLVEEITQTIDTNPGNIIIASQGSKILSKIAKDSSKSDIPIKEEDKDIISKMAKSIQKLSSKHKNIGVIQESLDDILKAEDEIKSRNYRSDATLDLKTLVMTNPEIFDSDPQEMRLVAELESAPEYKLENPAYLSDFLENLEDDSDDEGGRGEEDDFKLDNSKKIEVEDDGGVGVDSDGVDNELDKKFKKNDKILKKFLPNLIKSVEKPPKIDPKDKIGQKPEKNNKNENLIHDLDLPIRLFKISRRPDVSPESKLSILKTLNSVSTTPESNKKMAENPEIKNHIKSILKLKSRSPAPKNKEDQDKELKNYKAIDKEVIKLLDKIVENEDNAKEVVGDPVLLKNIYTIKVSDNNDDDSPLEVLDFTEKLSRNPENANNLASNEDFKNYMKDLYSKDTKLLPILQRVALCTGNLANSEESRKNLSESGSIKFLDWGLSIFPYDLTLLINTTWALRRLARKNPENSSKIMETQLLTNISNKLKEDIQSPKLCLQASHMTTNMTFRNQGLKKQLQEKYSFLEILIRIFLQHSDESNTHPDIVISSLKSLANLTVLENHSKISLHKKLIIHMNDFYQRYPSNLLSTQIMLSILGNMSHNKHPNHVRSMVDQGALDIISGSFSTFEEGNRKNMSIESLDSLENLKLSPIVKQEAGKYGLIKTLLGVIKRSKEVKNMKLVERALNTLKELLMENSNKEEALELEGHITCCDSLKFYVEASKEEKN